MGQIYRTTGLVLGRTNFGEADRIVTFLTAERGKVRAVAKGVRRIKSRLGGHLEPFGFVDLVLASGKNLDVVTSARMIKYWPELTTDFNRLGLAHLLAQLLAQVATEGQPQPELYLLAEELLPALVTTADHELIELYLKLRVLDVTGYRPDLSGCGRCGDAREETEFSLSAEEGGMVCRACMTGDGALSTTQIKLWRLIYNHSFGVICRVQGAAAAATGSLPACDDFYRYHFGRRYSPGLAFEPVMGPTA